MHSMFVSSVIVTFSIHLQPERGLNVSKLRHRRALIQITSHDRRRGFDWKDIPGLRFPT